MKRIARLGALLFAVLMILSTVGCGKVVEHTMSVDLFAEKTLLLDKERDVDWESEDAKIVSVDQKGKIKGLKPGEADVTASVKDKPVEIFHITVEIVPVESISINPAELKLEQNETAELSYTLSPSDASDYKIEWSSSDASIASIDEAGKLQANKPGSVTITCTAPSGVSATLEVTVTEIMAKEVSIDHSDLTLDIDDEQAVSCTVQPASAAAHPTVWTSSNESVATVDANGVITARGAGTCTISVQVDEQVATMEVNVTKLNKKERAVVKTWKGKAASLNGKVSTISGTYLTLTENKDGQLVIGDEKYSVTDWYYVSDETASDGELFRVYTVVLSNQLRCKFLVSDKTCGLVVSEKLLILFER